ncbi:urease accessory protein UreE [Vulgatibacter incomptus]|uniref:Urease accessory protein UreE n=1 Tax=Vulgatibacter incomptus TaxID=1391653 RepID=A0A0K1PG90_9BACT|nr:urease accessory protein UreE [Vulgatibacter incomptus]AKU92436.1 Urease accessory protein UreE [Vulgatibacter incomptus]
MITLREILPREGGVEDEVVLPFEQRRHSRLRVVLASGRDAAILLARGASMRDGDRLGGSDASGALIAVRVIAAPEDVYRVTGDGLIRAAYHLGNRHVPLELGDGFLRLERDPVLRELLEGLGFEVAEAREGFDPEPGAYGGRHGHAHAHEHEHEHA